MSRHLAKHALRLGMSLFANIEDVIALRDEVAHKIMRHRHIRTGRIDTVQTALFCALLDQGRNTMCRKNDRTGLHLLQNGCAVWPIQRNHAEGSQFFNRVTIMDDLPNNIDGSRLRWVFGHLAYYL